MLRVIFAIFLIVALGVAPLSAQSTAPAELFFKEGIPKIEAVEAALTSGAPLSFAPLVSEISRAVVSVEVVGKEIMQAFENGGEKRGNLLKPDASTAKAKGSGFILSENGYVVTNAHVIEGAEKVRVRILGDKHEYPVDVLAQDRKTDVALLKIRDDSKKFNFVYLGNSDQIEIGDWVIAIGNQFQLGQTVTAGIISAKARKIFSRETAPLDAFIQTDASINPGSSGGPLVNLKGQVIGVASAIYSPRSQLLSSGFNIGIGFAIPINQVKEIISELKERGRVRRGFLGVMIQEVNQDVFEALDLAMANMKEPRGALVADVLDKSPASKAGIQRGDLVLSFADKEIIDHSDLPSIVARSPLGVKLPIKLLRKLSHLNLEVVLEEVANDLTAKQTNASQLSATNIFGFAASEIPQELAALLKIRSPKGILVESVEENSVAAVAGLARGDIIERFDNIEVDKPSDLDRVIKKYTAEMTNSKKGSFMVLVRRSEGTRYLVFKIG
ncbi:MAG TPA: trypsin-like peptidase domain-containing protein [Oligoflexia bacterium]|nr:trypsin-like peptidase domain-containing protein [Oligoflexia bacterium]